jgi:hypothetical protein
MCRAHNFLSTVCHDGWANAGRVPHSLPGQAPAARWLHGRAWPRPALQPPICPGRAQTPGSSHSRPPPTGQLGARKPSFVPVTIGMSLESNDNIMALGTSSHLAFMACYKALMIMKKKAVPELRAGSGRPLDWHTFTSASRGLAGEPAQSLEAASTTRTACATCSHPGSGSRTATLLC